MPTSSRRAWLATLLSSVSALAGCTVPGDSATGDRPTMTASPAAPTPPPSATPSPTPRREPPPHAPALEVSNAAAFEIRLELWAVTLPDAGGTPLVGDRVAYRDLPARTYDVVLDDLLSQEPVLVTVTADEETLYRATLENYQELTLTVESRTEIDDQWAVV